MDPASGTLRHARGDFAEVVRDSSAYAAAESEGDYGGMALATVAALDRVLNVRDPASSSCLALRTRMNSGCAMSDSNSATGISRFTAPR